MPKTSKPSLSRRNLLRTAYLAIFGAILGKMSIAKAQAGILTIDLSQWDFVMFTYKGKRIAVPVSEIFEVLNGPAT